jgi:basic membrane protein A
VELLEMNRFVIAEGTEAKVEKTIEGLKKGRIKVFYGNYIGVNPMNPANTIDLNTEYIENQYSSRPSFHYILKDFVIIEN